MLGNTVNEMTITRKLSRVDEINKEGACTMASQGRGSETSADDNGKRQGSVQEIKESDDESLWNKMNKIDQK